MEKHHVLPEKIGRYVIGRLIDTGGMGTVYEAHDPNIDRPVAVKIIRHDSQRSKSEHDEIVERFHRECRIAGSLNHPNIVEIYDSGIDDASPFIAMEYLAGGCLADLLAKRRPTDIGGFVKILACICEALHAVHEKGIVHRDIKPKNILASSRGIWKLADFGIAHLRDSHLTKYGSRIGSPSYMSPEQCIGSPVDRRSDLFSVGTILYQFLTGSLPFCDSTLEILYDKIIHENPRTPMELNPEIPSALNEAVLKSLEKDPEKRFQDAQAMATALFSCLDHDLRRTKNSTHSRPTKLTNQTILTPVAVHGLGANSLVLPLDCSSDELKIRIIQDCGIELLPAELNALQLINRRLEAKGRTAHYPSVRYRPLNLPSANCNELRLDVAPFNFAHSLLPALAEVPINLRENILARIKESNTCYASRLDATLATWSGYRPIGVQIFLVTRDRKTLLRKRGEHVATYQQTWDSSFSGYCWEQYYTDGSNRYVDIAHTIVSELSNELSLNADQRKVRFTAAHIDLGMDALDITGYWFIDIDSQNVRSRLNLDHGRDSLLGFPTTIRAPEPFVRDAYNILVDIDEGKIEEALGREGASIAKMTPAGRAGLRQLLEVYQRDR